MKECGYTEGYDLSPWKSRYYVEEENKTKKIISGDQVCVGADPGQIENLAECLLMSQFTMKLLSSEIILSGSHKCD